MKIVAFIVIMGSMGIYFLTKKENRSRIRMLTDPLFGIGVILGAVGNFVSGTMLGRERSEWVPSASRDTVWTLENDPFEFVFVNSIFILLGIALIIWGLFIHKGK